MKSKELDALAEAVRADNYRKHAFEAQRRFATSLCSCISLTPFILSSRGLNAFSNLDDQAQKAIEVNTEGLDWERISEKVQTSFSLCKCYAFTSLDRSLQCRLCSVRLENVKFDG